MVSAIAEVPTANGSKYMQQLAKHWSHKLEVEFDAQRALIRFPSALTRMEAGEAGLTVTVEAADAATVERYKGVVATHLDRFAFREAPLSFDWTDAP
jgi:uncharacterized protein